VNQKFRLDADRVFCFPLCLGSSPWSCLLLQLHKGRTVDGWSRDTLESSYAIDHNGPGDARTDILAEFVTGSTEIFFRRFQSFEPGAENEETGQKINKFISPLPRLRASSSPMGRMWVERAANAEAGPIS